jgi:hypothetical protein
LHIDTICDHRIRPGSDEHRFNNLISIRLSSFIGTTSMKLRFLIKMDLLFVKISVEDLETKLDCATFHREDGI